MTDLLMVLLSLAGLAFVCIFCFWLYEEYRVERFRHKLFVLRDELFDSASTGKLQFDDQAYELLRTSLNGFIRYAHTLSLLQFIFLLISPNTKELKQKIKRNDFADALLQSTQQYSKEQRAIVNKVLEKMHRLIVIHIAASPMALVLIVPVCALLLFYRGVKYPFLKLDEAAYFSSVEHPIYKASHSA